MDPKTIHLLITTKDLLQIGAGDNVDGYYYQQNGRISTAQSPYPATAHYKMGIGKRQADMAPESEEPENAGAIWAQNQPIRVVTIPGNTIRGRSRISIGTLILKALADMKTPVKLETFNSIMSGASSGQPASTTYIKEMLEALQHPVNGLLGGGSRITPSGYIVGTAWPVCPLTLERQLVPEAYADLAVTQESLTGTYAFNRTDKTLRQVDPEFIKMIEGGIERIAEHHDTIAANREERGAARKEEKSSEKEKVKKTDLTSFNFIEATNAGVTFVSEITTKGTHCSEVQFGLLLIGLEALANEGQIGGFRRLGFGRVAYRAILQTAEGPQEIFEAGLDGQAYRLNMDVPEIASAVNAFKAIQQTLTKENLDAIYTVPETVEKPSKRSKKTEASSE